MGWRKNNITLTFTPPHFIKFKYKLFLTVQNASNIAHTKNNMFVKKVTFSSNTYIHIQYIGKTTFHSLLTFPLLYV